MAWLYAHPKSLPVNEYLLWASNRLWPVIWRTTQNPHGETGFVAPCLKCDAPTRWYESIPCAPLCRSCRIDASDKGIAFATRSGAAEVEGWQLVTDLDPEGVDRLPPLDEDGLEYTPKPRLSPMSKLPLEVRGMMEGYYTPRLITLHKKLEAERRSA